MVVMDLRVSCPQENVISFLILTASQPPLFMIQRVLHGFLSYGYMSKLQRQTFHQRHLCDTAFSMAILSESDSRKLQFAWHVALPVDPRRLISAKGIATCSNSVGLQCCFLPCTDHLRFSVASEISSGVLRLLPKATVDNCLIWPCLVGCPSSDVVPGPTVLTRR